jgi:hypothetical protein
MPAKSPLRWPFQQLHSEGFEVWTWRVDYSDGSTASPGSTHQGFGPAMNDAMAAGFRPSKHDWLVDDMLSAKYFSPGADPRILMK